MYVLLSNSVSSRRGPSGAPDHTTEFPNYFLIDYVRVYQAPAEPVTIVAQNEEAGAELEEPAESAPVP
jgi:hypothetical protein